MARSSKEPNEITLVHSSACMSTRRRSAANNSRDGAAGLALALSTARMLRADIMLLAGDTCETNQLSRSLIDGPVIFLPLLVCRS